MKFHTTKDGKKIKLADLELDHLKNIINWIERKSKEGFTIGYGGGFDNEEFWYEKETLYGERVKQELNYSDYKAELERRKAQEMLKS